MIRESDAPRPNDVIIERVYRNLHYFEEGLELEISLPEEG
jgi:hypothetical protein